MNETIGFIGLGDLGQPIAHNLLQAGYPLKVYNRTPSKAEPLVALGAELSSYPRDVLTPGGIVVTVVSDDAALEDVVMSEGFLEQLRPGGIHLSMSTISPEFAQKLATLHAQHGSVYIEAPVFGRREAAEARQLWICLSGPAAEKERIRPLLETTSQGIFDFGEAAGAAVIVKLCGNFMGSAATQAMAEALSLAQRNGLDATQVIDMLTQTLFSAPIYQSYGPVIARDPEHRPLHWISVKDVGLFNAAAARVGSPMQLSTSLNNLFQAKSLPGQKDVSQ